MSDIRTDSVNIYLTRGSEAEISINSHKGVVASQANTSGNNGGTVLLKLMYPFVAGDRVRIQSGAGGGYPYILAALVPASSRSLVYNPIYLGSFNTRSNVSFPAEVGKHYVIFANNGIAGAGYSFNISGATADWSQGISVNNGYNNIVTVLATATDTAVSLWFKNAASYGSMYVCQID